MSEFNGILVEKSLRYFEIPQALQIKFALRYIKKSKFIRVLSNFIQCRIKNMSHKCRKNSCIKLPAASNAKNGLDRSPISITGSSKDKKLIELD